MSTPEPPVNPPEELRWYFGCTFCAWQSEDEKDRDDLQDFDCCPDCSSPIKIERDWFQI